jgi:hypothetical protein
VNKINIMGLSVMKKKVTEDEELLSNARIVMDKNKKDTLGTKYDLLSGPLGTKVTVYKNNPKEHRVSIPGVGTRVMSKESIKDYVSSTGLGKTQDMPLSQLSRLSNLSKAQQEDVKKIKSNK